MFLLSILILKTFYYISLDLIDPSKAVFRLDREPAINKSKLNLK